MAPGVLRIRDAAGTTYMDYRYSNTVGSLTAALTFDGNGRELSDIYTLVASAVSLGSPNHATITVQCDSDKGPYDGAVFTGVVMDGATTRDDIVPGFTWTPTASGSLANGWTTTITCGIWEGLRTAGNPTGTQLQLTSTYSTPGETAVTSGDPGMVAKVQVYNTSAEAVANAKAVLHPRCKLINKAAPRAISYVQVVNDTPFEDQAIDGTIQPIIFTFANLDTAATPDEIDVLMNENGGGASTFDVLDIDAANPITSTQLKMDGSTRYQITESGSRMEGVIFTLASTATNSSVENLMNFNIRHTWIAPDVAGTPGTYVQTNVTLTQSGETSGTLLPSGTTYLWIRSLYSSLASNKQNPFPGDVSCEYALTGEADWLA